jgi:hypothetical protein
MAKVTPEALAASGTEDGEQSALFCYARQAEKLDYRWELLHSIPNGGRRGAATAARMAATGAKAGYPDVGLDIAAGGFHGLRIEMKVAAHEGHAGGRLSEAQKYWHQILRHEGYSVVVCYGWKQAVIAIESYLNASLKSN